MSPVGPEIQDLLHLWRELMAASRPRWSAADLTFTQLRALSVLARRQPMRVSDLAEALDMSIASASALVDRMARRGLVGRRDEPDDRRTVLVEVAARGRRILEALERGSSEHFTRLIERMTDEERAALATTLRAFVRLGDQTAHRSTAKC
jgi:DNA-binding MarR family transcriptional regulator